MQDIKKYVKRLYYPPPKSGFTVIIMSDNSLLYDYHSKNKALAIQAGVLKAKSYSSEGRQRVKLYIYDHSTEILDEVDFTKFQE